MFGLDTNQLVLLGIGGAFLLSKAGKLRPLLENLAGLWNKGVGAAKDAISPQETVATIMTHLKALDDYADKHGLQWGDSLKSMLADAGKIEFDRETTAT